MDAAADGSRVNPDSPAVPGAVPPRTDAPAGLLDAVEAYEAALMANDVEALDAFFAPGPDTLRGDASGVLVGHDRIAAFRARRGGTPRRSIHSTHVRAIDDDHALVVTVGAPVRGGRGQQTQLWRRDAAGWLIDVAHVSAPPPAIDSSVWRVVGTPLVPGALGDQPQRIDPLPLAGLRVAVKDLFDVAGHAVGGGVPAYLAESRPATEHAPAVAALLAAGAEVTGIARTDEFAYSIAGRNPHYGTPPNPAVVGGIPGGSSNGPASAVALGQADIGLGTDTGGSVRVPASYQGLWGLRTTHGAVDRGGLLPLAPSFDTVGWLTRDAGMLRAAASTSLAGDATVTGFVTCDALSALADDDVRAAFEHTVARLGDEGLVPALDTVELPDADGLLECFRTVQAAEAWAVHGAWVATHPGALGADIASRFAWASGFTAEDERAARTALETARAELEAALAGRTLLLPSASSAAPQATASAEENERTRARTLRLTCVAGILGAPGLSVPLLEVAEGPVGFCLVGPRGSDLALIDACERFARALA
ncbi:AtzH-like domain-containing protein [Marisediminicola senii]|uniref:AtzH-like domain-containing protein n=1 Tax=Marisediminicola senii TaxID=2711233 RepID=UPI0013EB7CF2|nr:AtzH-like domain-containing protein [Marisediminicola senii]